MNIFDLRDTAWFHLDKEYPVQEVYIEIRHLEHIEKNSGKRESSCCIVLPECEAEELKTARGPLVIGKGLGGLIYVYLPEQWKQFVAILEESHPDDKLKWRTIKRYFYGCTCESEAINGEIYLPEYWIRVFELGKRAVLLKYKVDGEKYYAIRQDY